MRNYIEMAIIKDIAKKNPQKKHFTKQNAIKKLTNHSIKLHS